MTIPIITELDRLAEQVSKGTWRTDGQGAVANETADLFNWIFTDADETQAAFIAALHNAYPELRRLALAGEKLAAAVEKMNVEDDKPVYGTKDFGLHHYGNSRNSQWCFKRDELVAEYRKDVGV